MLAMRLFFWPSNSTWDGTGPTPSPTPAPAPGGGGGHYQSLPDEYWEARERHLLKNLYDLITEEDMRKNKDLEAENAILRQQLTAQSTLDTSTSDRLAALATENANLRAQLAAASRQLSNPVVQAAATGDWEAVRNAMLDHSADAGAPDVLGMARALRDT